MRYTLDELKAMSNTRLRNLWVDGLFPFDRAFCGHCLTQHATGDRVRCVQHYGITANLPSIADTWLKRLVEWAGHGQYVSGRYLKKNLEQLYALRLFFDSLYPQTAEVEHPQTREAELQRVALTHWDSRSGA